MVFRCLVVVAVPLLLTSVGPSQSAPLQLRARVEPGQQVQAEIDSQTALQGVLLVSDDDTTLGESSILRSRISVSMSRVDPLRLRGNLDFSALVPDTRIFLQALTFDAAGTIETSAITALVVGEGGVVGGVLGTGRYEGPEITTALFAVSRTPPLPGSYGVHLSFLAPSNDWALSHHVALQRPGGLELLVVVKEPAEGEGELDVTERHDLMVDLGSLDPGELRVLVASTTSLAPAAGSLRFRPLAGK